MPFNLKKTAPESTATETEKTKDVSPRFHWILKDAIVLACIGLAFFLFLVMFSYSPQDPGFETVKATTQIENYGGKTGAWVASFLLYLFGLFGFLIPFGIFMAGILTLKIRVGSDMDYTRFLLSLFGLVMMMVSGAALASLYYNPVNDLISLPYSGGGVVGYESSQALVSAVDLLGATVILLVLFALGFSLFTSYSWLTIMDVTGWYVWKGVRKAHPHVKRSWEAMRDKAASDEETPVRDHSPRLLSSPNSGQTPAEKEKVLGKLAQKVKSKTHSVLESKAEKTQRQNEGQTVEAAQAQNAVIEAKSDSSAQTQSSELRVGKKAAAVTTMTAPASAELPSIDLLNPPPQYDEGFSEDELTAMSLLLEQRLKEFGVQAKVEAVQPGPVVTLFEILPAAGVKVSQINNLAKDLARVMQVKSVRVVDVIPGKAVVGIEVPNDEREIVSFREVIASNEFQSAKSPLTVALGKDIAGKAVVADIAKTPHLLVAGTTGAGKSVGINSMILSLLYKSSPKDVRLIMVDPKMLELSVYEDIPHLLTPVVTDMSDAANALRWCVFEMDRRYQLMAKLGVRNIAGYNSKVKGAIDRGEPIVDPLYQQKANFGHEMGEEAPTLETLPYIVVVVDEFADLIMVVGKEIEQLIARIAQKARAAGIHLILATQRPSVNVITGLIKANIPTRISFMVNTKIDSRTILDQGGAEQLLGMGDMLYMAPGAGAPRRVHGAFMTDEEVHKVAAFVKSQGEPQYLESVTQTAQADGSGGDGESNDAEQDLIYDQVVSFVIESQRVSVSLVQRQFKIGYNRAARIVEAMESAGVVSPMKSNGNRDVLVPKQD